MSTYYVHMKTMVIYTYNWLIIHCKSTNIQGITCLFFLNMVVDNNTNDNYNDIATITPMTTSTITPALSSPPLLGSMENNYNV